MNKFKSEWNSINQDENEEFRIANCGKFCRIYFNPALKQYMTNRFYCGRFNKCDACMDRRVQFFSNTLKIPGMCFAVDIAETDYQGLAMMRKVGAGYYTQFPREDGIVTFFIASTKDNGMTLNHFSYRHPVLLQDISDKDFRFICTTPRGRRVTGFGTKDVRELNLIFNGVQSGETETRNIGLTIPFLVTKISIEKLNDLIESIRTPRVRYPEDYSSQDAVMSLQTICSVHIRTLETAMKNELIFPKVKSDFFQFEFDAKLFKSDPVWTQEDIF